MHPTASGRGFRFETCKLSRAIKCVQYGGYICNYLFLFLLGNTFFASQNVLLLTQWKLLLQDSQIEAILQKICHYGEQFFNWIMRILFKYKCIGTVKDV